MRLPVQAFHVVERRRLLDRVSRAVRDAPLTLVSAPAGSGKTVLTAAWVKRHVQTPVAWLSPSDDDASFLRDVRRALADAGAGTTGPAEAGLDELSNELLGLDQPVVLVLDAAERVHRRSVFDQLDRLLDASGDRLRVVMTTRVDPPMPLHRYRLEGTLAEIRHDDLAFNGAEVAALLEAHDVTVADTEIQQVLDRTEGWAAGVRLAALAMRSGAQAGALNGFATDYLVAEVFGKLAEDDQDFLLRISLVDEVTPELAGALAGRADAGDVLKRMTAGNTFVQPVHGKPSCYRIHPLFREFLRAQTARTLPVDDLHRRAADWYDAHGDMVPAVRHAAATSDWERAAGFVVNGPGIGDLLLPTTAGKILGDQLASMPDIDTPDVHLVRAALALASDDLSQAEHDLARCEGTSFSATVLTMVLRDRDGSVDQTLLAARRAREQLAVNGNEILKALVLSAEGTAYLRKGDLDIACAVLGDAVRLAGDHEDLRLRCVATLALAEACRGHLSRGQGLADLAERLADESVAAAERPAATHLAHAWVALERQDLTRAQHCLTRARRLRETQNDELLGSVSTLLRARLMRDRGDTIGARYALRNPEPQVAWLREYVDAEAAGVGLERDEPDLTNRQTVTASQRVEELLDNAHSQWLDGNVRGGRSEIAKALSLARGERIRRPFTHPPARIRAIIRNDHALRSLAGWLRPEQTAATAWANDPEPIIDDLSERELDVLRLLSGLRSTEEIAAELFISVNTVKTHVRKILRKLSVSSRNEAVRRAWDLNLI